MLSNKTERKVQKNPIKFNLLQFFALNDEVLLYNGKKDRPYEICPTLMFANSCGKPINSYLDVLFFIFHLFFLGN